MEKAQYLMIEKPKKFFFLKNYLLGQGFVSTEIKANYNTRWPGFTFSAPPSFTTILECSPVSSFHSLIWPSLLISVSSKLYIYPQTPILKLTPFKEPEIRMLLPK